MAEELTLVTGFPAFTAKRLVRELATRGDRVALLAQPKFADAARDFLAALRAEGLNPAVDVLVGDVLNLDMGLSGKEMKRLAREVRRVHHIASIYFMGVTEGLVERVNVDGARNVLDLAADLPNLERLVLWSTAFVAGDRTGVILEEDLEAGQRFRNTYERTKFEAERMFRARMKDVPISVVRPSVIVGDSRTGEIDRLDGPYQLIRTFLSFPVDLHLPLPGEGYFPLNLVPADFVVRAADVIARSPSAVGKTFHLTDPNPLPARRVFEIVADVAHRKRPRGAIPSRVYPLLFRVPFLGDFLLPQRHFIECFDRLMIFNSMNTLSALADTGVGCPPFPSYAGTLIRFAWARFEEADKAAPRREKAPDEDPYF
ncbi:MAG: SDR family oxidoreductase [Deltaproteobacteria bacterium]|nr:SDR family oxidoreductase [Deltaproteobacteria bacterium]